MGLSLSVHENDSSPSLPSPLTAVWHVASLLVGDNTEGEQVSITSEHQLKQQEVATLLSTSGLNARRYLEWVWEVEYLYASCGN